ncbi:MAG: hypothetical protein IJN17_08375 [Clostridia bacterium]|nr:hypothetical protein [Clostridia bacterium]
MKKFILLILAVVFCIAVLASCGSDSSDGGDKTDDVQATGGDETGNEDDPGENQPTGHIHDLTDEMKAKVYKWVEFDLPADLRQAVVDYMYEQASVEWVCAESFGVKEEWEHWGINLDFQKGVKYTGQPYANSQVNVALFKRVLKDGTYTSPSTSWDDVHGSQCVSSILNAMQQCFIIDGWSYSLNPGSESFDGIKVGDYKVDIKPVNQETPTLKVCEDNGKDVIFDAYSKLQKGDTIITVNNWVHARMVVDVTIVKNNAGVLNTRRSVVKCVEQTNAFDTSRSDVKTTWRVDKMYTFEELYADGYLPATYEELQTGISHIPYITLDVENTPNVLAKGQLLGNVRSNYPVRYVILEVLGENGEVVKEYTVRGQMNDYAFGLRKYSYNLFGDGLEKGNYTFVMTAGIAAGEIEFERVAFTVE